MNLNNCQELDNPMQTGSSNSLAIIHILCSCFFVSERAVNNIKSSPHYCCCSKIGLAFIFLLCQQNFNLITHFHKDHEQENFQSIQLNIFAKNVE